MQPPTPLPPIPHLLPPPSLKRARTPCLGCCIDHSETFHLHARPIRLDALRLVIKGIDPLNLYELQFVPAARPVRGLRNAGTSATVCACCFAVVKERGKRFLQLLVQAPDKLGGGGGLTGEAGQGKDFSAADGSMLISRPRCAAQNYRHSYLWQEQGYSVLAIDLQFICGL